MMRTWRADIDKCATASGVSPERRLRMEPARGDILHKEGHTEAGGGDQAVRSPIDYGSQLVQPCANKTPSKMLPNVSLRASDLRVAPPPYSGGRGCILQRATGRDKSARE